MTLLERFSALVVLADRVAKSQQDKARAVSVNGRAAQVRECQRKLAVANAKRRALEQAHVNVLAWPDSASANKALVALQAFSAAIDDSSHGEREFESLAPTLDVLTSQVGVSVATAIQASKTLLRDKAKELDGLKVVATFGPKCEEAQSASKQLLDQDWSSVDAPSLKSILEKQTLVLTKIQALRLTDVPESVRKFFSAAQQQHGATLDLLDAEVRTWLESKGLLSQVRLVFRQGVQ